MAHRHGQRVDAAFLPLSVLHILLVFTVNLSTVTGQVTNTTDAPTVPITTTAVPTTTVSPTTINDPCSPNPCMNGGNCTGDNDGTSFTCDCPELYDGSNCESPDVCLSFPCLNDGNCTSYGGDNYTCDCSDLYYGDNCDEADACLSDPCLNGNCTSFGPNSTSPGILNYTCTCSDLYTGDNCEIEDGCLSSPCQNGGTCMTNTTNGLLYTCECPEFYEGALCETGTDECLGDPCENGGTCVDLEGDYNCMCVGGWTEKNCTEYIAEVVRITGNRSVEQGTTIKLECSALGIPLPDIAWYFNNTLLSSGGRISVDSLELNDTAVSTLQIINVVYEDQGNYTCRASNSHSPADSPSQLSVEIEVFRKPEITEGLDETQLLLTGKTLYLDCTAWGIPQPTLEWYQSDTLLTNQTSDQRDVTIVTDDDNLGDAFSVTSSLTITNVTYQLGSAGSFSCRASNPFGMDKSETTINVLVGAIISEPPMSMTKKTGENVEFTCTALGNPQPTVKWYFEGSEINPDNDEKYDVGLTSGNDENFGKSLTSMLTINSLSRTDEGNYSCRVSNDFGQDQANFALIVLETPGLPVTTLTALSTSQLRVTWTRLEGDEAGNPPFDNCTVEYRKTGEEPFTVFGTFLPDKTSHPIDGLIVYTEYEVVVYCTNEVGPGQEATKKETTFQAAPSQPINVATVETQKDAAQDYQCTIDWDTPLYENWIIIQYTVYYKLYAHPKTDGSPMLSEGLKKVTVIDGEPTLYVLLEAASTPNSVYEITVTGTTIEERDQQGNTTKEGPPSDSVTCTTDSVVDAPSPDMIDDPAPSPDRDNTANTIWINIVKPNERNGEIHCYEVIVIPTGTKPSALPDVEYPADDVKQQLNEGDSLPAKGGAYAAYIISGDEFQDKLEVEIGRGEPTTCDTASAGSGRKKRSSSGAPKPSTYNVPLEAERNYVTFLRAFVLNTAGQWVYSSGAYSSPIKTGSAPPPPNVAGIVVGVICGILALVVIVLLAVWYMRQKNETVMRPNRHGIANPALEMKDDIEVQPVVASIEFDVDYPKTVVQPFPCSDLPSVYYSKHNDDNRIFSNEYASLPDRPIRVSAYASKADENINKNRYINILAYDHSRVVLQELPDQPGSDYINACYVDGYRSPNKYIAAQGPLDNTISDFWRMVWEEKTATIVMLTNLEEKGRVKCSQYWPTRGTLDYDDLTVTLDETTELSNYVIRYMTVSNIKSDEPARRVTQLHYISWNDFDAPKYSDGILQFIKRVKAINPASAGPLVVHCSAGVGRTGTFIAIDSLIEMMAAENRVDIFNFVCKMRENRNKIVQTEGQYVFVHLALMEHHLYGNTESEVHNIRHYWQNLNQVDEETGRLSRDLEFEKLNRITLEDMTLDCANIEENKAKNRLVQVVPYDNNRVQLERQLGDEHSNYINASYIDGYYQKKAYIATQGPMLATINDFWRLVWESKSTAIIMLTQLQEKGQERCEKYWSDDSDPASYGNLAVQLKDLLQLPEYQLREFQVTDTKGGEVRTVRQYHFHGWPEVGAPEAGVGMIDLIGQVQRQQHLSDNRPIIVHCSSGAGRTGAFCVLSLVLERVKAEGFVDIFQTVKVLRQQRPHMVQTVDQYQFIYKAVLEYLDSFDNYENFR